MSENIFPPGGGGIAYLKTDMTAIDNRPLTTDNRPRTTDNHRPLSYEDLRRFLLLVVGLMFAAWLLRELKPILLLFATVFIIAMVLNPLVAGLEKRGIRRGLAVALMMVLLLSFIGVILGLIVPLIVEQGEDLVRKMPGYWKSIEQREERLIKPYPTIDRMVPELETLTKEIRPSQVVDRVLKLTSGVLGGFFITIFGLLILVFILADPHSLVSGLLSAVPARHRAAAGRSLERILEQMTLWIRAVLINGVITGISTGVLLHLVGVQPALIFGMLAFFGEFVPNIGPVVVAMPAIFVALGDGLGKGLAALGVILFVQQVETNILVPYVMARQLQLHPVSIIFFALAMGSLFGIPGAILAVPSAAITKVLFEEFYLNPQQVPVQEIEDRADDLVMDGQWTGQKTAANGAEDEV
ncbi:MAG: AI-2E family transporter [Armatimonadota bacterium]|nr:AI-2E family transporter [Armatimonadota bacterium]